MIRFRFAPQGSPRLRIAYSPLWECVISVRVLLDPASHALFQPWIRRAAAAVDAEDVRLLGALVRSDGRYIPDFLAPPPSVPGVAFGAELVRVRNTPPEVLRAEIARAAGGAGGAEAARLLARYDADPLALRAAVAEVLERYWRAAIMPEWPRIEALLAGEVLWRARTLALHGAGEVLRGLHPAVTHPPDAVHVSSAQEGEVQLGSSDLLLVPSLFAWPDVFTVHDRQWRASIYYPARGAGTLWAAPAAPCGSSGRDALALLAGSGRARVLRALVAPATTTELAARLGASPASVSVHLRRLWKAGCLERIRVGRHVFYQVSAMGHDLLAAVGNSTPA